jgi:hypothetical protein
MATTRINPVNRDSVVPTAIPAVAPSSRLVAPFGGVGSRGTPSEMVASSSVGPASSVTAVAGFWPTDRRPPNHRPGR